MHFDRLFEGRERAQLRLYRGGGGRPVTMERRSREWSLERGSLHAE